MDLDTLITTHRRPIEAGIAGRRVRDALADAALRHAASEPLAA